MSRGKHKMSDIPCAHKTYLTKLCKRNLGGRVWHPGSSYGIRRKDLRYCSESIDDASVHMISYHTKGGRMCDHHNGRFQAKFSLCMGRILTSRGIHDPHTVFNTIVFLSLLVPRVLVTLNVTGVLLRKTQLKLLIIGCLRTLLGAHSTVISPAVHG